MVSITFQCESPMKCTTCLKAKKQSEISAVRSHCPSATRRHHAQRTFALTGQRLEDGRGSRDLQKVVVWYGHNELGAQGLLYFAFDINCDRPDAEQPSGEEKGL